MYSLSTCLATIYRNTGTAVNEFGDPIGSMSVVVTNVPCGISLMSTTVNSSVTIDDLASKTPRSVRRLEATLPRPTDVQEDDVLLDQKNNTSYSVLSVTREEGIGYSPDVTVELKRVN